MINNSFARFARAFFIFWHFADVLVLSTTWNNLFCSCVDEVSISWQMFNFVFLPLKRWLQFNSRIVRTHFASVMTLHNSEMIAETRSYISRWRSHCRRRRVCVNSLKPGFHIVVSVVSVVSVVRKKFIGQLQFYGNLPYKCSIQKKRQIQLFVRDRRNPICPLNFFRTTDTTDTTIWKPRLKPGFHIVVSVVSVVSVVQKKFILSRTTSCICRFFSIEHLYGRFP